VLSPTSTLVQQAQAEGVGVPAFNGITLEHGEAIVGAAERAGRPVILAISHNAVRFHGALAPIAAAYLQLAEAATVPVGLHLDHVEDLVLVEAAADLGFGSVMFDASTLPYDDNVAATRRAACVLHARGLWLEAELGEIGGKGNAHAPHVRTDPAQASRFVADTAVDALAVAVGSSHAMTSRTAELDLDLVTRLRDAAGVPLVLHGSSGVGDAGLAAGVRAGLVKVNVGTQLNIAYTDAVRSALCTGSGPDPRHYLQLARAAMEEVVYRLIGVISAPEDAREGHPEGAPSGAWAAASADSSPHPDSDPTAAGSR
jgi:fructose-bisphosphate aldolase class II